MGPSVKNGEHLEHTWSAVNRALYHLVDRKDGVGPAEAIDTQVWMSVTMQSIKLLMVDNRTLNQEYIRFASHQCEKICERAGVVWRNSRKALRTLQGPRGVPIVGHVAATWKTEAWGARK